MPKNERILTVYHSTRSNGYNQIPKILLQGNWLKNLGYSTGNKIVVSVNGSQIQIQLVK